ncbi:MAG: ACT domain-containing protein [Rhodospirillaceae bacterium]
MAQKLVVTFIADDRPGLVEKLANTVAAAGGNWLDSRMAHLAAKFAGVAEVEIDPAKSDALEAALAAPDAEGSHLMVEPAPEDAAARGPQFDLELIGPDHPGIVRDLSHLMAQRGFSVEEVETDIREAPHAGGTLFHAHARLRGPGGYPDDELLAALDDLADRAMVDIEVEKVT